MKIFKALEEKNIKPNQGIFFNGQIFDAYTFVSNLIRSAKKSIILIDNYIDDTVLTLFTKRKNGVKVTIFTKKISNQLKLDLKKYNEQYEPVEVKIFKDAQDRFLIIDEKEVYHFGASLKDLGKKWFAFSKNLKQDYISLTDIARYKDAKRTDYIIQNWLRNRNTIEFLGIWERLNNPYFNPIEFEGFRKLNF